MGERHRCCRGTPPQARRPPAAASIVAGDGPKSGRCSNRPSSSVDRFRARALLPGATGPRVLRQRDRAYVSCDVAALAVSQLAGVVDAHRNPPDCPRDSRSLGGGKPPTDVALTERSSGVDFVNHVPSCPRRGWTTVAVFEAGKALHADRCWVGGTSRSSWDFCAARRGRRGPAWQAVASCRC